MYLVMLMLLMLVGSWLASKFPMGVPQRKPCDVVKRKGDVAVLARDDRNAFSAWILHPNGGNFYLSPREMSLVRERKALECLAGQETLLRDSSAGLRYRTFVHAWARSY